MRLHKITSLLLALAAMSCASARSLATDPSPTSPTAVVDRQVSAYNAKNVDAFLAFYAPDAELFEFPETPRTKGTEALRERYTKRFADPILHVTIANRIAIDNKVIDHEKLRITWPEGPGTLEAVAIYEVTNGLIARGWFIFGPKTVDSKP